jgi:hypothetical protein
MKYYQSSFLERRPIDARHLQAESTAKIDRLEDEVARLKDSQDADKDDLQVCGCLFYNSRACTHTHTHIHTYTHSHSHSEMCVCLLDSKELCRFVGPCLQLFLSLTLSPSLRPSLSLSLSLSL